MRADLAGNTLLTARAVSTDFLQTPQGFYDSTGSRDQVDLYRLSLASASSLSLQLGQLTGDSDLQVLDASGRQLYSSNRSSTQTETLTVTLEAGEYYVNVAYFHGDSDYYLEITGTPQTQAIVVPPLAPLTPELPQLQPVAPTVPLQEPTTTEPRIIPAQIVSPQVAAKSPTGQRAIDALINPDGYYWDTSQNGGVITYSFYGANSGRYYGNEQVAEVNDAIKTSVREIMQMLERYIDVRFVEVADTATSYGVVRYMYSNGGYTNGTNDFYAYSYYPWYAQIGGDVHLNATWDARDFASFSKGPGTDGYTTLIHETLHALGLKHPGNYDAVAGSGEGVFLDPSEDHKSNTVMSYNSLGIASVTPLNYDVRALQYLYGTRNQAAESSVYQFTAAMHYTYAGQSFGDPFGAVNQTIWDTGGIDTIDLSGSDVYDYYVDLRDGGRVTTQTMATSGSYRHEVTGERFQAPRYATNFAFGTVMEQVVSSGGKDRIIANQANNVFLGYGAGRFGDDVLENTNAGDVLDLLGNFQADLSLAVNQDNLVINWANGDSVTIVDYFTGSQMRLLIEGQYFTVTANGNWVASVANEQIPTRAIAPSFVSPAQTATSPAGTGQNTGMAANNLVLPTTQLPVVVASDTVEARPAANDERRLPRPCHCVLCRPIVPQNESTPVGFNLVGRSHLSAMI